MTENRRPKDVQPGNHNTSRPGLPRSVERFLSELAVTPDKEDFLSPEDYADELERSIAITRRTIRSILEKDPSNYKLLCQNVSLLQRLIDSHRLMFMQPGEKYRSAFEDLGRRLSITPDPERSQDG